MGGATLPFRRIKMAEEQVAYTFDKASINKMLKGLLWAIGPAILMAIVNFIPQIQFANPIYAMLATYVAQILSNIAKEWAKGKKQTQ
jgi:hypothetical protein